MSKPSPYTREARCALYMALKAAKELSRSSPYVIESFLITALA